MVVLTFRVLYAFLSATGHVRVRWSHLIVLECLVDLSDGPRNLKMIEASGEFPMVDTETDY
jgi:hypothetical protein